MRPSGWKNLLPSKYLCPPPFPLPSLPSLLPLTPLSLRNGTRCAMRLRLHSRCSVASNQKDLRILSDGAPRLSRPLLPPPTQTLTFTLFCLPSTRRSLHRSTTNDVKNAWLTSLSYKDACRRSQSMASHSAAVQSPIDTSEAKSVWPVPLRRSPSNVCARMTFQDVAIVR